MAEPGPDMNDLRAEIDRIDDEMLAALLRRAEVAAALAPLKARAGAPLLRPGREAAVLRRLIVRAGGGFDALALVRIWREIMSAALRAQGPFTVAVAAPEGAPACWTLARAQYGASTPMTAAAGAAQAVAAVADGRAQAAVVPYPQVEEAEPWWARLAHDGAPRIVARLPVAAGLAPEVGCPDGVVVAAMTPEASGDDRTLVALETSEALSRAALARAVEGAGLTLHFTASGGAGSLVSLAEVGGFHPAGSGIEAALRESLGAPARHVTVIGAYALALDIPKAQGAGK